MRNPDATPAIVKALCQGLGVEDIAARGIAPVEHSRDVIARLRRLGLLVRVYAKSAKDNENLLGIHPKGCINEAGDNGATNATAALEHSEPRSEVRHMSHHGHYGDSHPQDKTEQSNNWQSIGELARRLVEGAK